jgi:hypothetical protein
LRQPSRDDEAPNARHYIYDALGLVHFSKALQTKYSNYAVANFYNYTQAEKENHNIISPLQWRKPPTK